MFHTEDVIQLTIHITEEEEMVMKYVTQTDHSHTEIVDILTDMKWIAEEKSKRVLLGLEI